MNSSIVSDTGLEIRDLRFLFSGSLYVSNKAREGIESNLRMRKLF